MAKKISKSELKARRERAMKREKEEKKANKDGLIKNPFDDPDLRLVAHTAYQQIGDLIAEVISTAVLKTKSTRQRRVDRREAVNTGRAEQVKKSTKKDDVENLRKANRSLKRTKSDLRNIGYREGEVKETEG